jgi:hypothetical protein
MPLPQAAGIGLTGLAVILLDVYFNVYTRSIGLGIGLVLASVLVVLKARWVDGPVLYYRSWGRVHRLPLTSVSAVSAARPKGGTAWVLLSAPGLEKPLRVYLRNRGYVMPRAAATICAAGSARRTCSGRRRPPPSSRSTTSRPPCRHAAVIACSG